MMKHVAMASFLAGTAVAAGTTVYLAIKMTKAEKYRDRFMSLVKQGKHGLPTAMENWVFRASAGMKERVVGPKGVLYVIFITAAALTGAVVGIVYLSNPIAAVILCAAGVVFPEQFRRHRRRVYRERWLSSSV